MYMLLSIGLYDTLSSIRFLRKDFNKMFFALQ